MKKRWWCEESFLTASYQTSKAARQLFLVVLILAVAIWAMPVSADTGQAQLYLPLAGRCIYPMPVAMARVTKVIDGDTVWVDLDGDGAQDAKVRYIGIDTPETTFGPPECYGLEATARNAALVLGQEIALEKDVSEVDRYDRLLRYVYVDGVWVNGALVAEGYARAKRYAPDIRYAPALDRLQAQAKAERRGAWDACGW